MAKRGGKTPIWRRGRMAVWKVAKMVAGGGGGYDLSLARGCQVCSSMRGDIPNPLCTCMMGICASHLIN